MPRDNSSKYAILGLLTIEPMSGYDIRKFAREVLNHFWNESYGRIYPILAELTREGLATKRLHEQKGRPDRHIYSITARGRTALQQWLEQPSQPLVTRNEATLKFFLGGNLPLNRNLRVIEGQHQGLLEQKLILAGHEKAIAQERDDSEQWEYYFFTLRLGQLLNEARIRWCEEVIARLRRLARRGRPARSPAQKNRRTGDHDA